MNNWKLGDRCTFTHRLNKQTWDPETYERFTVEPTRRSNDPISGRTEKRWVPKPFEAEGVIVGHRTVQNNWVDREFEYGSIAVPTKYISTYLVAYDLHKNPVYVLPEHMERVP